MKLRFSYTFFIIVFATLSYFLLMWRVLIFEVKPEKQKPFSAQEVRKYPLNVISLEDLRVLPGGAVIARLKPLKGCLAQLLLTDGSPANLIGSKIVAGCYIKNVEGGNFDIIAVKQAEEGLVEFSLPVSEGEILGIYAIKLETDTLMLNSVPGNLLQDITVTNAPEASPKGSEVAVTTASKTWSLASWSMSFRPGMNGLLEKVEVSVKNNRDTRDDYVLSIYKAYENGVPMMPAIHTKPFSGSEIPDSFAIKEIVLDNNPPRINQNSLYAVALSKKGEGNGLLSWFGFSKVYPEGNVFYSNDNKNWTMYGEYNLYLKTYIRQEIFPSGFYTAILSIPDDFNNLHFPKLLFLDEEKDTDGVFVSICVEEPNKDCAWYIGNGVTDLFSPIARKRNGRWEIKSANKGATDWMPTKGTEEADVISETIHCFQENRICKSSFNAISSKAWEDIRLAGRPVKIAVTLNKQGSLPPPTLKSEIKLVGYKIFKPAKE